MPALATEAPATKWVATATYPKQPDDYTGASKMEGFISAMLDMRMTGCVLGPHGIGKTSTFFSYIPETYGWRVVRLNAANITPEEMLTNAPVNISVDEKVVLALRELLMDSLGVESLDGEDVPRYVLLIDDSLQAGELVQNQMMQIACNLSLGSFDLRKHGCMGVFLTDNENLAETSARRSDIAVLDRMATMTVTANDTGWRYALAKKFPQHDLKPIFKLWAQLQQDIRHVLSPRCVEHIIANLTNGNPGIWGLPLLNGSRVRLTTQAGDNGKVIDRTKEVLDKFAAALNAPNPDTVPDKVRRLVRQAIENNWAILIQGAPGGGKTEVVKEVITEKLGINPMDYYWSMATTDVEMLCVPIPVGNGLKQLLTEKFYREEPKVFIWDEFNRPKDKSTFAKLMEVTQEWTIAGVEIPNLKAQIAIQNPPYAMGRKLNVAKYNIAQADRFTAAIEIEPEDIPANEWLLTQFPLKYAAEQLEDQKTAGKTLSKVDADKLFESKKADAVKVAEVVLDWFKSDIDDEGRQWITARGRERLVRAALRGVDLELTKIYLGDGQYAPTVLAGLMARLAERPMTGLRDLAENLPSWTAKLVKSNRDTTEGTGDADAVHQAFTNAEVSQLREHMDTVVALLRYLPPKYKTTYLMNAGDKQRFWIDAMSKMSKDLPKS